MQGEKKMRTYFRKSTKETKMSVEEITMETWENEKIIAEVTTQLTFWDVNIYDKETNLIQDRKSYTTRRSASRAAKNLTV